MIKREDSLRSLGFATIATDRATREKLNRVAAAAGKPLSVYLRELADASLDNTQGGLKGVVTPVDKASDTSTQTSALCTHINNMAQVIPMRESKRLAINSLTGKFLRFGLLDKAQWLYDELEPEYLKIVEREAAKDAGQLEWGLNNA